ncbi:hypothetical protein P4S68_06475 [Pseudoalteromonas sp. Hal099]
MILIGQERMDVDNEDSDSSSVDQRANIFGDPLHSKPVSIDYGDGNIRILDEH